MKICPVGIEFSMRMDRGIDTHDEANNRVFQFSERV